jgi:hypothetical protein
METSDPLKDSISLSVEKIIDVIRSVRNDLVKEHLQDERLSYHYKDKFRKELTNVKKEFLKRDLKELLIAPVDLAHYSKVITQLRETNSVSLSEKNNAFFYEELDRIFSKYSF